MDAREGSAGFEFTETLKPLEKLRDRLTIVSNLAHPMAGGKGSDAGADHARSAAVFLGGAHPEKGTVHGGKTIDQVLVDHIGQETPLPSIEVCIEEVAIAALAGCALQHHLVAERYAAAADGKQSAGRLRAAVRRRHERGAAAFSKTTGPQHPRRGDRQGRAPADRTRLRRSRATG